MISLIQGKNFIWSEKEHIKWLCASSTSSARRNKYSLYFNFGKFSCNLIKNIIIFVAPRITKEKTIHDIYYLKNVLIYLQVKIQHTVSRRITYKIGKNWFNDDAKRANMREKFLEEVKEMMQTEGYDPHRVINIDQLGFDKEIYGHRTLNIRDSK